MVLLNRKAAKIIQKSDEIFLLKHPLRVIYESFNKTLSVFLMHINPTLS
jgi:hypothetical protein